ARAGALGDVPAAAPGMRGVALELLDLERAPVHIREQPARGLAVEADRREERVLRVHAPGPRARVELLPAVPERGGRIAMQALHWRLEIAGDGVERPRPGAGPWGGVTPRARAPRADPPGPERRGQRTAGEKPRGPRGVDGGMRAQELAGEHHPEREERPEQRQTQPPRGARAAAQTLRDEQQ